MNNDLHVACPEGIAEFLSFDRLTLTFTSLHAEVSTRSCLRIVPGIGESRNMEAIHHAMVCACVSGYGAPSSPWHELLALSLCSLCTLASIRLSLMLSNLWKSPSVARMRDKTIQHNRVQQQYCIQLCHVSDSSHTGFICSRSMPLSIVLLPPLS